MRRAAVSIPSNIAEGAGRASSGEFRQFVCIARGSNQELQTQLIIAKNLDFFSAESFMILARQCDEIGRMLSGLESSLKSKSPARTQTKN